MVVMTTLLDEPIVFEVSRWTLYSSVNFRLSSGVRKPWNSFSACSPRLARSTRNSTRRAPPNLISR